VKNQQYCGRPECSRARKRKWHSQKKKADPDYAANQEKAQKAWRERNPGYWRRYRQEHPEYAEKNRLKQRERNRTTRHPAITPQSPVIAKMDSIGPGNAAPDGILPGCYQLIRLNGGIAKMDSIFVEIRSIPEVTSQTVDADP